MITARLFARLREQAGRTTEELDLAGASVADVYSALRELHPALEANLSLIQPALNESFAEWTDAVKDGDEIAFIPPVSGGSEGGVLFEVTSEVLDARRLEAAVAHAGAGAICTFTGIVRDNSRGEEVTHLAGTRVAADGVSVFNPAFDVTPSRLIAAIVTERGIARAPYEASLATLCGR